MTREELAGPPDAVARGLLGAHLVAHGVEVRLLEVEAYGGADDPASHAYRGERIANRAMFGPPGHLYVYLSHGLHQCANVVTGPVGTPTAVLLRGGTVCRGLARAEARRGRGVPGGVLDGPGKLGQALGLDRHRDDGLDLLDPESPVRLEPGHWGPDEVLVIGPRVGLTKERERPWRFRLLPAARAAALDRRSPSRRHPEGLR